VWRELCRAWCCSRMGGGDAGAVMLLLAVRRCSVDMLR
jgi:hypothetical protein